MRNRIVRINDKGYLEIADDIPEPLEVGNDLFLDQLDARSRLGFLWGKSADDNQLVTVAAIRQDGRLGCPIQYYMG